MNDNIINYYAFSIINSDNISIPSTGWNNFIELDLRNTWYRAIGNVYDVITALSYKNDAAYYAIFRKVPTSSGGDFQVVYVRVPYFLEIDQDSFVAALERLKVYVKDNEIQSINGEDSQVAKIVANIIVNNNNTFSPSSYMQGTGFAFRRLRGKMNYKYDDIIKGEYQSDYNKYGVLFILDENVIPIGIDNAADLTDRAIKNHVLFSKSQLVGMEEGVSVYYNDKPFDEPVLVEANSKISLTFKKKGFVDQNMDISVRTGEVGRISWKFPVTKDMFDVRDKSNRIINNFRVVIEGRNLPYEINESKLGNKYNISVSAEGYKTKTVSVQFHPKDDRVSIVLEKMEVEYFIYPKNSSPIQLVFPPEYKPLLQDGKRPFACYKIVGRNQKDNVIVAKLELDKEDVINCAKKYEGGSNWFSKKLFKLLISIISLLGALIIGTLIGHYVWKSNNLNNLDDSYAEGAQLTQVEAKHNPEKPTFNEKVNSANDYLNTHQVWDKNEMEKIELLKGVWDALNTYDYNKIIEVNNKYHFDAPNWRRIISAIDKKDYIRKKGCSPICKDGDTQLTIEGAANPANNYLFIIRTEIVKERKPSLSGTKTSSTSTPKTPKEQTEKKKSNDLESDF